MTSSRLLASEWVAQVAVVALVVGAGSAFALDAVRPDQRAYVPFAAVVAFVGASGVLLLRTVETLVDERVAAEREGD